MKNEIYDENVYQEIYSPLLVQKITSLQAEIFQNIGETIDVDVILSFMQNKYPFFKESSGDEEGYTFEMYSEMVIQGYKEYYKKKLGKRNLPFQEKYQHLSASLHDVQDVICKSLGRELDVSSMIRYVQQQYPQFKKSAGVFEGYTLEEHIDMVLKQYKTYFHNKIQFTTLDKNFVQLILIIHDIGKPQAHSDGDKNLQHSYSEPIIKKTLENLGYDERLVHLGVGITRIDPIGPYITGEISADDAAKMLADSYNTVKNNIPHTEFFDLCMMYYQCDASSYTSDAGGIPSLDHLFTFSEDSLSFVPHIQEKMDILKNTWKQLI